MTIGEFDEVNGKENDLVDDGRRLKGDDSSKVENDREC